MINTKTCLLFLFLISLVAGSEKRFDQRSLVLRLLHDLKNDELDDVRRHHEHKTDEDKDEIESDRQVQDDDIDEELLELREKSKSNANNNTGPVITLQNRAAMNTRLRVLFTDENCTPFLAETGLLMTAQTKSIKLPNYARNIKVIIQKDMFAENWRVVYTGTLTGASKCYRIIGVTVSAKIKECK